ncbi:MAG: MerR family transcriptional regulator [Anaerolineae bacterium]
MTQSRSELTANEEPLFNIGAVSRMTDISETTLRVWERRYDFPQSARTAGGHRLYSQQDVLRLQWVKLRIDEGMQTSQAIRALQHIEREGEGLVTARASAPLFQQTGSSDSLPLLHQRLLESLLAHGAEGSSQVLSDALALYPMETLIFDVILPVLNDIGDAWSRGQIDVATEHFATNHLRQHLVMWTRTGPPCYHVSPVVLACAPGELHEGSLLILSVLLRRLRWPVTYLGQTMPLDDLVTFVNEVGASILVFVAMTEETARTLSEWTHWLPDAAESGHPIIGYGGRIFSERPELTEQMPGMFLGKTLQEGVALLDRTLHELNPLLR